MHLSERYNPPQRSASGINVSQNERVLSLVGGTTLALFAAWRRDITSIPALIASVTFLYKGVTGDSPLYRLLGKNTAVATNPARVSVPHEQGFHITRAVTINRPAADLYAFWRDPTNLPQVINYVESVQVTGIDQAHWTLKLPGGIKAEFDVEVYTDVPNEVISWRSLPDSSIKNAGSIRFRPAPADRGAEVQLTLEFVPPAGPLGKAVLNLFGEAPQQYISQFLREFKQVMETGEKATTEGQTSGRIGEVRQ